MQEKDRFLKRIINLSISLLFFAMVLFSKTIIAEEVKSKIEKYFTDLNFFSSKFIQSNDGIIEEGYIYFREKKLRLDYFNPDRTLKISEKKGVYINHELKEEEFFSTEKTLIKMFYDIFVDYDFFSSLVFEKNKKEIIFEKEIFLDSKKTHFKIIFEESPLLLRKIIATTQDGIVTISFNGHNYTNNFDKDFFSFVPIYLD